ncbi:MAG: Maf family nucleotide pyrophosphatase [Alphaproteobacteria bacterium]|nr:Maf family nucleotide pyrophosphatase [Alphaproteobacteria bacterium]
MTAPTFILASASVRRVQLLAAMGITPAQIVPADIDETPLKNELPHLYAKRVAMAKAAHVAVRHPDALILAADTVVACGKRILPKAEDEKTARACLKLLSGKRHRVYTAIALHHQQKIRSATVMTVVQFTHLSKADIDHYIASKEWEGKAGGYAIQGLAEAFIPRINGSVSNVIGLPLTKTRLMLIQAGLRPW